MSLRCSLLGHDYGDAEIEREREEEGTEVVVTVREFKECDRCGERSVVSENKEVTALETPTADAGGSSGAGSSGTTSDTGGAGGGNAGTASAAGGPTTDRTTDSAGARPTADSGTSPAVENDFEAPQTAEEDDGVILEDDDDDESGGERHPGQWPDEDANQSSEDSDADPENRGPREWPDVGREDEGYDAEPSDGEHADVQFGGGLTPESASDSDDDDEAEFVNAEGDTLQAQGSTDDTTSGGQRKLSPNFTAGASAPSMSGPSEDPDVDAEFVCPECDFRAAVADSSMRAGDICPECRRGYLAQE